jgi:hypothetical protein
MNIQFGDADGGGNAHILGRPAPMPSIPMSSKGLFHAA